MDNSVLVVGGSGGLGSEICRQELGLGNSVTASWCNNCPQDLDGASLHRLDLYSIDSINSFLAGLDGSGIKFDRVYFASAINGYREGVSDCTFDSGNVPFMSAKYMQINCYSIIHIIHFLVFSNVLKSDAKICALTSIAGSSSLRGLMVHNQRGGNLCYRISKSALNCSVRNIAFDLETASNKIVLCTVYPGWVQTPTSGKDAPTTPRQAVERLIAMMANLTSRQNGLMLDLDGIPLPF